MTRPISLIFYLLALVLASCTIDAYDKGEGELSRMRADFVLAFTDSQSLIYTVETDEGERLTLTEPMKMSWAARPDSAYRMVLYYNKVDEARADVVAVGPIGVVTPHRLDSVVTDPVRLESVWVGTNRRFLNVGLYLMTGATEADSARHVLGAVLDSLHVNADSTSTLHLTLYHDQAGVPQYYSQRTFVSLPLDSIDGAADSLSLHVSTYDGVVIRTLAR